MNGSSAFWGLDAAAWAGINALATIAAVLVASVAAVFALRQLRLNARAMAEQLRPFVSIDFAFRSPVVFLEVSNTGLSAARDIRFEWSTPPRGDDDAAQADIQRWLIDGPMPFLAPGRSIRYWMGVFPDDGVGERQFQVTVKCLGPDGRVWTSIAILDFDQWARATVVEEPLEQIASELRKGVKELTKASGELPKIAATLSPIGQYFGASKRVQALGVRNREAMWVRRTRLARTIKTERGG